VSSGSIPSIGIYYESGKEPSSLEDPPKLHLLVESNEEWRVSCWFHPCKFVIIHFVWVGRASCPGDQAPVVRSFCCRIAGRNAQSNRTGSLQRCLAAGILCALYDIRPLCISTLSDRNKYIQIHMHHHGISRIIERPARSMTLPD